MGKRIERNIDLPVSRKMRGPSNLIQKYDAISGNAFRAKNRLDAGLL